MTRAPRSDNSNFTRNEALIGLAVVLGLTLCLYVPHVAHGGFYTDDYTSLEEWRFLHPTLVDVLGQLIHGLNQYRDGSRRLFELLPMIGHLDAWRYQVIGLAIAAFQCCLFFGVLRMQGMRQAPAVTAASILVVCPWIDASRMWWSTYGQSFAICLYLAGLLCAQVAFSTCRSRRALALHAASLLLFLAAVETFEGTVALVAATGCLYVLRVGFRRAARRWSLDILVALIGFYADFRFGMAQRGATFNIGHLFGRVATLLSSLWTIIRSALPGPLWFIVVMIVGAGSCGLFVARRRRSQINVDVQWWIRVELVGCLFTILGLAPLLAAPVGQLFVPSWTGPYNRLSLPAAPGEVVVLVATVWLVGLGLGELIRSRKRSQVISIALAAILIIVLAVQEFHNEQSWANASYEQHQILENIGSVIGSMPARHTAVAAFEHPNINSDGDPIFDTGYDLQAALRLRYDDPTLLAHAYELPVVCHLHNISYPPIKLPSQTTQEARLGLNSNSLSYGLLYFIDISTGVAKRITNRSQCAQVASSFVGYAVPSGP